MAEPDVRPEEQDEGLAAALQVLANPVRLALLRGLRTPRVLKDIRVAAPDAGVPERDRGGTLARQTVKHHLEQMARIGVVALREVEREYGATVEYVSNHQRLYAIAEEFRELSKLRATADLHQATMARPSAPGDADPEGPCLVLVKGLDEGTVFRLPPPPEGPRRWVVGRRRTADVPLDFDPFVSGENSVVDWDGAGHGVATLPGSQNGTAVNFRPLPEGRRHPLRTGDVVGVGRSLLLFRG